MSVASGDLRLLATLSDTRLPDYKDIPTLKEKGYTDAVMYSWFAFMAPPGTPKEVIQKLDGYIQATLKDNAIQRIFEKLGFQEAYLGSKELPAFMSGNGVGPRELSDIVWRTARFAL